MEVQTASSAAMLVWMLVLSSPWVTPASAWGQGAGLPLARDVVADAPGPDLLPVARRALLGPRRGRGRFWGHDLRGRVAGDLARRLGHGRVVRLEPALALAQRVEPAALGPPGGAAAELAARVDAARGDVAQARRVWVDVHVAQRGAGARPGGRGGLGAADGRIS